MATHIQGGDGDSLIGGRSIRGACDKRRNLLFAADKIRELIEADPAVEDVSLQQDDDGATRLHVTIQNSITLGTTEIVIHVASSPKDLGFCGRRKFDETDSGDLLMIGERLRESIQADPSWARSTFDQWENGSIWIYNQAVVDCGETVLAIVLD